MTQPRSPYRQPANSHPWRDDLIVAVTHRYARYFLTTLVVVFLLTVTSSRRLYIGPPNNNAAGNSHGSIEEEISLFPTEVRNTAQRTDWRGTNYPPPLDSKSEHEPAGEKQEFFKTAGKTSFEATKATLTDESEQLPETNEKTLSSQEAVKTTEFKTPPSEAPAPENLISGYESYMPKHHPVLNPSSLKPDKKKPVQLQVLMGSESSYMRYLVAGVERSVYLKLVGVTMMESWSNVTEVSTNSIQRDQPMVWLVDVHSLGRDCHKMERLIQKEMEANNEFTSDIFLVMIDTSGSSETVHCKHAEKWIPRDHIRIAKSGIIQNRYWDEDDQWVHVGEIVANNGAQISGGPVLHVPFVVRESMVTAVDIITSSTQKIRSGKKSPVDTERPLDVAHFWNEGDYSHYGFLRRRVSSVIAAMEETMAGKRKIHGSVEILGNPLTLQNETQPDYVHGLLSTKIVVVAQRDEWEDHYRLFDSLACGAMVMTDAMHGLPDGFEHNKNIVVYDSARSLEDKLRYYLDPKNDKKRLEIAQKGWELAMGRHRSWHRIEQVLFGNPVSHIDRFYDPAPERRKSKPSTS